MAFWLYCRIHLIYPTKIPVPKMNVSKLFIALSVLLMSATAANAQQAKDSATTKKKVEAVTKTDDGKTEGKKAKSSKKEKSVDSVAVASDKTDGKKAKGKKEKDNTVKLDSTSTRADSIKANLPKALRDAKPGKTTTKKPPTPKLSKKNAVKSEGAIIPGAEEAANAATKDKLDRTMKGPSGQRVYASPKGGRYYFDANGNKKFIRNDLPTGK
jgi:colicin import membrane protein